MGEQDGPFDVRRAGVLLHVTSLPGHGSSTGSTSGDLGDQAYRFVDFLAEAGCSVWQVLPLVPTHERDGSPYNALSAMAGNPKLISREHQAAQGLDRPSALDEGQQAAFAAWCAEQSGWLEPYVEFTALRDLHDHAPWQTWPPALRDRDPRSVAEAVTPLADRVQNLRFEQWVFAAQWARLREYAASKGVLLFGDLPIFVSLDSADVWAFRELFQLDEEGRPITVSGCPPDYFAQDGQRWNNPHYDWDAMSADGFAWWRRRIARQRELFDLVRVDHFRGFEAAWHVPVEAATARGGRWVAGPASEILSALVETAGPGTLVAEDLGVITPDVEELRIRFGLPGMKVLQFAFDGDPDNPYLPRNHEELSVVYTGTHDNDTTLGWWRTLDDRTRDRVRSFLVDPDEAMPWALIRLAMESTARLSVVPAQDLLGLDSGSRMNTPGTDEGNWEWQAPAGAFDHDLAARIRALVAATDRLPTPSRTDSATRLIHAEPARVFAAFVDAEALTKWLPPSGMSGRFERFDPRPGGSYRLVLTYDDASSGSGKATPDSDIVEARFVEIVPNVRVVQAVDFVSDDPAFAGTMTVTWQLSAESDGTRVRVRADDVPPGISPEDHAAGLASSLAHLAAFVEV